MFCFALFYFMFCRVMLCCANFIVDRSIQPRPIQPNCTGTDPDQPNLSQTNPTQPNQTLLNPTQSNPTRHDATRHDPTQNY